MHWIQVSLEAEQALVGEIEETLNQLGAVAITWGDAADQPLFEPDPGETPLWDTILLQGLFPADQPVEAIVQRLAASHRLVSPPKAEILEDKDWSKEWMQHFKPVCCGDLLWICPGWLSPPEPDKVNLLLDPGMAFGTGTHPTTRLCLSWLDQQAQRNPDFAQFSLIDYGCGSGILAIAALLLGCRAAWATDIDIQAIEATRYNAQRNGIDESRLNAALVNQAELPVADIMVANILAGPLIELAPLLAAHTRPGGYLILSGLLESQIDQVSAAWSHWFEFEQPIVDEGWVLLSATRLSTRN